MSSDEASERDAETTLAIRKAVTGDEISLNWVLERFTPWLMASARQRISGDLNTHLDPEDLVQDVWAVAIPRLADIEPRDGRFTPVLLKFLASVMWRCHAALLRKHLRGGARVSASRLHELPANSTDIVHRVARSEATERLLASLDRLQADERATVVLRGIEQVPNKEAAIVLGEPPNTVAKRFGRALEKLKAFVTDPVLEDIVWSDTES